MQAFLLWPGALDCEPVDIAIRMQQTFAPLFASAPHVRVLGDGTTSLVSLHLPVRKWRPAFFEQGEDSWALASEYPLNARSVLAKRGVRFSERNLLSTLCKCLQTDPSSFLPELAPPFSLVWSDASSGNVHFHNDGLGMAQVFEYHKGDCWALSNRIECFRALGATLEPDPLEWATRLTLGWFPLELSGYKSISYLAPGTHGQVTSGGVRRTRVDAISKWVCPPPMSEEECLTLARTAVHEFTKDTIALCEAPLKVGLSGGWDSRAVVSVLRSLEVDFSLRVRGFPARADVIIARRLAEIAGLPITVKTRGGLPPDDAEACKRCISMALLWQSGYMVTRKHKVFLARKAHLTPGTVNVMGQHAGTGKADFARYIHAYQLNPVQYESHFLAHVMSGMPSFVREPLRDSVREIVLRAYNQADVHDLAGLRKLDYFYLYEQTRRWGSATVNSQPALVVAPFLNPDFVKACYAFPAAKLSDKPFHRHITEHYSPDWKQVPYEGDVTVAQLRALGMAPPSTADPDMPDTQYLWRRSKGNKKFNAKAYWDEVGAPIIAEALQQDGFWTSVFDPDLARASWQSAPDALAVTHLLSATIECNPHAMSTAAAERRSSD